jgi:hypothetical protein
MLSFCAAPLPEAPAQDALTSQIIALQGLLPLPVSFSFVLFSVC